MHVLEWALAWVLIVVFAAAAGWGLAIAVAWLARLVRAWWYALVRAKHLLTDTVEEFLPDRDFYGSAILEEERHWLAGEPVPLPQLDHYLPADPVPCEDLQSDARIEQGPDWRKQTATDLSPEALAQDRAWHEMELGDELQGGEEVMPLGAVDEADRGSAGHVSSGPGGVSSLAPGPELPGEARPDFKVGSLPREPAERLADTGDIRDARLLADAEAFMRWQDEWTAADIAERASWCARVHLDLTAALT